MDNLLINLQNEPKLLASINECKKIAASLLSRYLTNFPDFTDHSIEHSNRVLKYAFDLLGADVKDLNTDEIYTLIMACYLHDVGMSSSKRVKKTLEKDCEFQLFLTQNPGKKINDYIREIHNNLSYQFILENWEKLSIPNQRYAEAIAIVSKGHRVEDLMDEDVFNPKYSIRSGSDFICLPFLSAILRVADELDITSDRTPDLLFDNYLPENKVSREEWEKDSNTYSVFFDVDEQKIVISATCDNRQIYENLQKRNIKIEETLLYLHKVIRHLPIKTRALRIEYNKIESKIEPRGFIPKNIRFSLDSQGTIETLLGEKLYRDKMVAIREALQNAIDTCRYKKLLIVPYIPQIKVTLRGNELTIEDNGMGMDEFTIENFFAKMGSCFYRQKEVLFKKFEAISEFGIGVFSYFLLCNYFDVETKFENKKALKFRVFKDPDSQFHFFGDIKKINSGTKLTLFLKESLSFEKLKETIAHYIRFVEIPIIVQSELRKEVVMQCPTKIDIKHELRNRIQLLRGEQISTLTVLTSKLETNDYSGCFGLILGKDASGNYIPRHLYNIIDDEKNVISVCQRGIFVFDSNARYSIFLKNFFGSINLRKKTELTLNRNQLVSNNRLKEMLSDFAVDILQKLFISWKSLSNKRKAELTREFVGYYLNIGARENLSKNLTSIIFKYFFIECYDAHKIEYMSLEKFLKEKNRFMLVRSRRDYQNEYAFKDIDKIFDKFKIPILKVYDEWDDEFYLGLFQVLLREMTIGFTDRKAYYIINNKIRVYDLHLLDDYWRFELTVFSNVWICAYPGITTSAPVNMQHPIIKFAIKNNKMIRANQRLHDLFSIFFKELHDFIFDFHVTGVKNPGKRIEDLNKILRFINRITRKTFKVSRKDFPVWIQEKI